MADTDFIPAYQEEWLEKGKKLFAKQCLFHWATTRIDNLPPASLSEVAFAGRSNVGKSSLINTLTNNSKLARTSNTPGRTQALNFFNLDDTGFLVDLPGYGFAAVSKERVLNWNNLIHAYLKGRSVLKRVFILIDSRHGIKKLDLEIFKTLDEAAVSYQVILTKTDKIPPQQLKEVAKQTEEVLSKYIAALPYVIATSSINGKGAPQVQAEITALFAQ